LSRLEEARERRAGEILLKVIAGYPEREKNPREHPALRGLIIRCRARDARKGQNPEAAALRLSAFASANVPNRRQTACGFNHAERRGYLASGESFEG
jgi:hypothetical protein